MGCDINLKNVPQHVKRLNYMKRGMFVHIFFTHMNALK